MNAARSGPRRSTPPSRTAPTVRRAESSDQGPVTATVVAAFARDPAWAFILGGAYDRLAPQFAGALFEARVRSGTVWVSDDLTAVAMWDPLDWDADASARAQSARRRYREAAGEEAAQRLALYNAAVGAAVPAERHWYLGVLATHPEHQGRGLASAVLAPVLADADRRGIACCLETSTVGNRAFYTRRGFTEATDVVVPGGPPTWWLRRPAAAIVGGAGTTGASSA